MSSLCEDTVQVNIPDAVCESGKFIDRIYVMVVHVLLSVILRRYGDLYTSNMTFSNGAFRSIFRPQLVNVDTHRTLVVLCLYLIWLPILLQ